MVKLKSYCCEYLSRNLNSKNVHTAVDLAVRHGLYDLQRRGFSFLQRSFSYIYDHDHEELIQYGPQLVIGIVFDNWIISIFLILTSFFLFFYEAFLQEKGWSLPADLVLKFLSSWVNADLASREQYFPDLLYSINWQNVNSSFIASHLEEEQLYHNSQEAIYSLISVAESKHVYLGQRYHEMYQSLNVPEQELDELNDSNR